MPIDMTGHPSQRPQRQPIQPPGGMGYRPDIATPNQSGVDPRILAAIAQQQMLMQRQRPVLSQYGR